MKLPSTAEFNKDLDRMFEFGNKLQNRRKSKIKTLQIKGDLE